MKYYGTVVVIKMFCSLPMANLGRWLDLAMDKLQKFFIELLEETMQIQYSKHIITGIMGFVVERKNIAVLWHFRPLRTELEMQLMNAAVEVSFNNIVQKFTHSDYFAMH
jgi:hypothetical protein